jgi:hypothetical protein
MQHVAGRSNRVGPYPGGSLDRIADDEIEVTCHSQACAEGSPRRDRYCAGNNPPGHGDLRR